MLDLSACNSLWHTVSDALLLWPFTTVCSKRVERALVQSIDGRRVACDVVLPMAAVSETRLHIVVGYTPQLG